jgi:hypothetical protein
MRLLTVLLVSFGAVSAAAQPEVFTITPDTLFWDRGTGFETPYVLRNTGPDALRLDSLAIGPCSHPIHCEDGMPWYTLRFERGGEEYYGFLMGLEGTLWDPEPPWVTLAPGDSARLYVEGMDGCPVCEGGDPDFDTVAPVLFWGVGHPRPIERALAYVYPVSTEPEATPAAFSLAVMGPNPFNHTSALVLHLPVPAEVEVALFDVLGRRVRTLAEAARVAGDHRLAVHAEGLAPGLYFVRAAFRTGREAAVGTQRLVLLR